MRPNFVLGCIWALCSCAVVHAQQQRPTALRDTGVITRAAPTAPIENGSAVSPNQFPTSNFPTAPAQLSSEESSSTLGDRAWTNAPRASARLSDSPNSPSMPPTPGPAPVVSAQYTSNESTAAGHAPIRTVGHPSPGVSVPAHEPKPLKPPTAAASKTPSQGSTGTVQMFVSVLSSLAIVIGLILAAAWLYRKAAPTISGALPKQVVQVLGRTPLAPRQQLVLLRLGSKLVLVSNLHGEVRTISEITDPLEVDRLSGLCEAAQPGSISESFRSVLHNMGRND